MLLLIFIFLLTAMNRLERGDWRAALTAGCFGELLFELGILAAWLNG